MGKLTINKLFELRNEGKAKPIQWEHQSYYSDHGKSYYLMQCPVCGFSHHLFPWSLAGSGKKCENPDCETAFFSGSRALTLVKNND